MNLSRPTFIHLRTHSAYSLGEGAVRIKDLAKLSQKNHIPAIGICDTNNLFGALEFSIECSNAGIQPIIGAQLNLLISGETLDELPLIVQNHTGYLNLIKLVSQSYLKPALLHMPSISVADLMSHAEGLIVLTGGLKGTLARLALAGQLDKAKDWLRQLQQTFSDRVYVEVQRHDLPDQGRIEPTLIQMAMDLGLPIVATNDVFFLEDKMFAAHDAFICIAESAYVDQDNRRRLTPQHYFKSSDQMMQLFADLPEAIANTVQIAQRCSWRPMPAKPMLPAYPLDTGETEAAYLERLAKQGLDQRLENQVLKEHPPEAHEAMRRHYHERLIYELEMIVKMGFPGYFLIVADFIQWAKAEGIPVGPGRGSGAGSLVAWALTITDIDPIKFGLIFERFLNPERVSMPDFDIDFCQDRRDEVIQYVRHKYGDDRVAQIITFGKLQARAVLRDVGRVLQIPYLVVDRICKLVPNNPSNPIDLAQALELEPQLKEEQKKDPQIKRMIDISLQLEGLYRHASTHAAGIVIGDRPLTEVVALYKDDKSDLPATQFNMKYAEMAGLMKFDFLGLKTLTIIEDTAKLVREQVNPDLYIPTIPLDNPKTFALLSRVETVGIFQLESGGMRDVLRRLLPNQFEDLVALVALFRPGPMDDIPRYIACKHGEAPIEYLHPDLEPILKDTFGVMVYQEQVMRIAQDLGGYSLGAADLLRRAMGKKIKSEMDAQQARFIDGATQRGISRPVASAIFDQMAKFASYGFNKSHSAPYALLSYQTAYLKANYPYQFFAASMTHDMHNMDKLMVFRQDLLHYKIPLLPPDVNLSSPVFSVEFDSANQPRAIRYGLTAIKNVGAAAMDELVANRTAHGPFTSIEDFVTRMSGKVLNKRLLEALIGAGAFDTLSPNRKALYETIEQHLKVKNVKVAANSALLFDLAPDATPQASATVPDWDRPTRLQKEFESVGFYISGHPMDSDLKYLEALGIQSSSVLADIEESVVLNLAGVVLNVTEKTSKTGKKYAFIQFSDPFGPFEVTAFSEALRQYRDLLVVGKKVALQISGNREGDQLRLTLQLVTPLAQRIDQLAGQIWLSLQAQDLSTLARHLADTPKGRAPVFITLQDQRFVIRTPLSLSLAHWDETQLNALSVQSRVEVTQPHGVGAHF